MTTTVVLNAAWQLGHNRDLIAHSCGGADVLLVCEMLATGGAHGEPLVPLLPKGWATNQDTSTAAKSAAAVAWNTDAYEVAGHLPAVKLSSEVPGKVRARYLRPVLLRDKATGDVRPYAAVHVPLHSTGQQDEYLRNLNAWLLEHPRAVVGGDFNKSPEKVAFIFKRPVVGAQVICLILPRYLKPGSTVIDRRPMPEWTDHPIVRERLTLPRPKPAPTKENPTVVTYPAPSPVYLGPAAHTSKGDNRPIHRIVIHSTVSPCEPGGARKIAAYFRSKASGGSAHYVVDPGEVVQVVYDGVVAQHAPPNTHSLGVEMCDQPSKVNALRWTRANQKAMLARTARLVAELCLAYDVPPYYVDAKGLKDGKRGVTTHAQVSTAFKLSTHWDPGMWPRLAFMRMVRAEVAKIKAGA